MQLIIPGRPVPAVRMTQRSKYANPQAQRYLVYKEQVSWQGRSRIKTPLPKTTNASVSIQFYIHKGQTPDIDNLIKSILDGLNGIAWQDDKQVVKVVAERLATADKKSERVEVEIRQV
jgi:crossover junction endodeoxyribonuclease RusA